MDEMIGIEEVIKMMGMTSKNARISIYRKVAAKQLRAYKPAGKLRFKVSDVEAYIKSTVVR